LALGYGENGIIVFFWLSDDEDEEGADGTEGQWWERGRWGGCGEEEQTHQYILSWIQTLLNVLSPSRPGSGGVFGADNVTKFDALGLGQELRLPRRGGGCASCELSVF